MLLGRLVVVRVALMGAVVGLLGDGVAWSQSTSRPQAAPAAEPGYLGVIADVVAGGGVQLIEVVAGGPAADSGMQTGDVIQSVNGRAVATIADLATVMQPFQANDEVTFVVRRGAQVQRVDVTLGRRPPPGERRFGNFGRIEQPQAEPMPAIPQIQSSPEPQSTDTLPEPTRAPVAPNIIPGGSTPKAAPSKPRVSPGPVPPPLAPAAGPTPAPSTGGSLLGVRAVPVSPEMKTALNLPETRGALIVDVREGSAAQRAGLPLEAVIVAVDGKPIESPAELAERVAERGAGAEVKFSYFRYGQLTDKVVKLGATALAAPGEANEGPAPLLLGRPSNAPPAPVPQLTGPPPSIAAPTLTVSPPATSNAGGSTVTQPTVRGAAPPQAEAETEALRRRVKELEARLAELEAAVKTKQP
jgi:membrane-associated protease RseP (regulator of RpoE activity)